MRVMKMLLVVVAVVAGINLSARMGIENRNGRVVPKGSPVDRYI